MASSTIIKALRAAPDPHTFRKDVVAAVEADCHDCSLEQELVSRLDTLLRQQQQAHDDLERRMAASTIELDDFLKATRTSVQALSWRTQTLHEKHLQVEDELIDFIELVSPTSAVADDETTPSRQPLIAELESLHASLSQLSTAKSWLSVLHRLEQTGENALKAYDDKGIEVAVDVWKQTISQYSELEQCGPNMYAAQVAWDMTIRTWYNLEQKVFKKIAEALDLIHWPLPVTNPLTAKQQTTIQHHFEEALLLEKAARSSSLPHPPTSVNKHSGRPFPPVESVAMRAVVQPLSLRFRYHFDGQRQTNRLDKPEWFFGHILNALTEHEPFVRGDLTQLISPLKLTTTSPFGEFCNILLSHITTKLQKIGPQLLTLPAVLAHTVYQALEFDEKIRDLEFDRDIQEDGQWLGTANVILGNGAWFSIWLEAERKLVDDKFYGIITSSNAWDLNEDAADDDEFANKPTISATHTRDLFDQVSGRYKPLPEFKYRAPFFLRVQVPLLDGYYARISGSVDAFEGLAFGLMRAVPGSIGESGGAKGVAGVTGAQRLLRASLSARWMDDACQHWDEEMAFIELFEDLNTDALEEAELQSQARYIINDARQAEDVAPSLFGAYSRRFSELADRTDKVLIKYAVKEITKALKPYTSIRWDKELDQNTSEISLELVPGLTMWASMIKTIAATLPPNRTITIYRQIGHEVEDYIISRIVLGRSVSAITEQSGRQLLFDVRHGLMTSIESCIKNPGKGLERLLDVCQLLALPSSSEYVDDAESVKKTTFVHVMKVAFDDDDNKGFVKVMKQIGVRLERAEVAQVMRRRPECWR